MDAGKGREILDRHAAAGWPIERMRAEAQAVATLCNLPDPERVRANAAFIVKACHAFGALEDALLLALPYVMDAEDDKAFKPGVVNKHIAQIRAALKLAEMATKEG